LATSRPLVPALLILATATPFALGCGSSGSSDTPTSTAGSIKQQPDTATGAKDTRKGKNKAVKPKFKAKKARRVKVAGRSPGVKASEPRWVDQYAANVSATQARRFGAPAGTAGRWSLLLLRGSYNLTPGSGLVGGTLRVSGDRMVFRQRGGCAIPKPLPPPRPRPKGNQKVPAHPAKPRRESKKARGGGGQPQAQKLGPAGTYRWRLSGGVLRFKAVSDGCANRRAQLPALRWVLQQ
jgi:hypothetical protein